MKKSYFFLLCYFLFSGICEAQDYLENDKTKIIDTEFENGIPQSLKGSFDNFDTVSFNNVSGLKNESYTTTNAEKSRISINRENIGRVVLYVKLFNEKDSILFNPLSKRKGTISIKVFRNNSPLEDKTYHTVLDDDNYKQIHFNINRAGVDRIEIDFYSKSDLFILDRLSVTPYNQNGIDYFSELENSEKSILDLTNNLENEAAALKEKYVELLGSIQSYHSILSDLITGSKFESLAIIQSNTLNPFQDDHFINHYNSVLQMSSSSDQNRIKSLTKELGQSKFQDIAVTLDNLLSGGRFSSLINLVSGLFDSSIKLGDDQYPIIRVEETYYRQLKNNNGKIKLASVSKSILNDINTAKEKNEAFRIYIENVIKANKEDLETYEELNENISTAKGLKEELNQLTWEIIKNFTDKKRSNLIDEKIDFLTIGKELEKNFKPDRIDLTSAKKIRGESAISISKMYSMANKYDQITSKIKTSYDVIYDIRPNERKTLLDNLTSLPTELIIDWKNDQDKIITEYSKKGGLKEFLLSATGRE